MVGDHDLDFSLDWDISTWELLTPECSPVTLSFLQWLGSGARHSELKFCHAIYCVTLGKFLDFSVP